MNSNNKAWDAAGRAEKWLEKAREKMNIHEHDDGFVLLLRARAELDEAIRQARKGAADPPSDY